MSFPLASGRPPVQAAGEHDGVRANQGGGGGVPQEPHGVQHTGARESGEERGSSKKNLFR